MKNSKKEQKNLIVDPKKSIKDIELGGHYVYLLQECLTYVLGTAETPAQIIEAYAKTEANINSITENKQVEPKGSMNPFESSIFMLTTLIGYLKEMAAAQGSCHEMEPLSESQLKESMGMLMESEFSDFAEHYQSIMKVKKSS
tara:strand:+ start:586 stop:1014 length:429 start_codon:yes stop_codon:yes gene_type:complete